MNVTQFKDTEGRVWTLDINIGHYLKFKSSLSIDISDSFSAENNWIAHIAAHENLETLLQMLEILIAKDLESNNLTVEDFYGAVDGNVVAEATDALLEAVVLFLPAHKQRAMRIIVDSVRVGIAKAEKRLEEETEQMMAKASELMDENLEKLMESK